MCQYLTARHATIDPYQLRADHTVRVVARAQRGIGNQRFAQDPVRAGVAFPNRPHRFPSVLSHPVCPNHQPQIDNRKSPPMSSRSSRRAPPANHGVILVDKPWGITSHDVVGRVRRIYNQREVGHTGTLDPAATGLLVLCLGEATKIAEYLTKLTKTYTGSIRFAAVSDTFDADGEIVERPDAPRPPDADIHAMVARFVGDLEQVPPPHSAKKVAGKRLYEYARAGENVVVEPRQVTVSRFELTRLEWPEAEFIVTCTSGTYVRRLAADIGEGLGCGAYLTSLRRTQVGVYDLSAAATLDALEADPEFAAAAVWSVPRVLSHWPQAMVDPRALTLMHRGHACPVAWTRLSRDESTLNWLDHVLALDETGRALAITKYVPAPSSPPGRDLSEYRGAWLQPSRQFHLP